MSPNMKLRAYFAGIAARAAGRPRDPQNQAPDFVAHFQAGWDKEVKNQAERARIEAMEPAEREAHVFRGFGGNR